MKNRLMEAFSDTRRISQTELLYDSIAIRNASRVYTEGFCSDYSETKGKEYNISILSDTTFSVAKQYATQGKVAVLNFANPVNPGGGVINGAMAQEECLCRSSNLYEALIGDRLGEFYQYHKNLNSEFFSDRLIYTPGVTVFKDDGDIPCLLPPQERFKVDVITCAAPYLGKRKYTNRAALKALFVSRITNILEAALDNRVDLIVLGAFGCGAFQNPPEVVAEAFKTAIEKNQYARKFKELIFAIKPDKGNLWSNNFRVFNKTFNDTLLENCPTFFLPQISMPTGAAIGGCTVGFSCLPSDISIEEVKDLVANGKGHPVFEFEQNFFQKQAEFLKWQRSNPYYKKQISVLGDSISTLDGFNPKGYHLFYTGENCEKSGVAGMADTWWGQVIDCFGSELLVNNSWSGSRVTQLPGCNALFPSGCSDERTNGLHIHTTTPDVILVYLGTNDWGNGVETGRDEDERTDTAPRYGEFRSSYSEMLKKLKKNYPNAEIWCCTLNITNMESNQQFSFPYEFSGVHIEEYNKVIRSVTEQENCKLIDLYSYHIPYDTIDGTHPTKKGMNTIAAMVIRSMTGQEKESPIDCGESGHQFAVIHEAAGTTKYVCTKCGLHKTESALLKNVFQEDPRTEATCREDGGESDSETAKLYSNTLRLTNEATGEDIVIQSDKVTVGRDSKNDIVLDTKLVSRTHATFLYMNNMWFIRDENSKNGVWLNGKRMISGENYQLSAGFQIDFSHSVTLTFDKIKKASTANQSETDITAILEAAIATFAKSDYQNQDARQLILACLTKAPLIVPIEIDSQSLLSGIDPKKLKKGDIISTQTDIKGKVLSFRFENGLEVLPLFTSNAELKKGPLTSSMKRFPADYIKIILQKGLPVIINPFSDFKFVLQTDTVNKILLPLIEKQNTRRTTLQ